MPGHSSNNFKNGLPVGRIALICANENHGSLNDCLQPEKS